jgi:diaminopimelate epimerase
MSLPLASAVSRWSVGTDRTLAFDKMQATGNDFLMFYQQNEPTCGWSTLAKRVCQRRLSVGADGIIVVTLHDTAAAFSLAAAADSLSEARADCHHESNIATSTSPGTETSSTLYIASVRFFNADGSEPLMCGNGVRLAAAVVGEDLDLPASTWLPLKVGSRIVQAQVQHDDTAPSYSNTWCVRVCMGVPVFEPSEIPMGQVTSSDSNEPDAKKQLNNLHCCTIQIEPETKHAINLHVASLSMGNPHCVIFMSQQPSNGLASLLSTSTWDEDRMVQDIGAMLENNRKLFPDRTNVEFVWPDQTDDSVSTSQSVVRQRTWERGVGETFACGSGACAVAVSGMKLGLLSSTVQVHLRGGVLTIEYDHNNSIGCPVYMTGNAERIFSSVIQI